MRLVEVLNPRRHDRSGFRCGEPSLDRYLREQATQHYRDRIATTHVLVDDGDHARILGYYSLAAANVLLDDLSEADRRRLPRYPVPAARLARLAVARVEQGKGLGGELLAHAVARCLALRDELGIRVMLVDALDDSAARFYRAYGFRDCTSGSRVLYLPLGTG